MTRAKLTGATSGPDSPCHSDNARPRDRYGFGVVFRDRLIATLRSARVILDVPGVLVAGSEVPNLLEAGAAATLVVSHDVDIAIPVAAHAAVKDRLGAITDLAPSPEEPSVWIPDSDERIELNFIGYDPEEPNPAGVRILEDGVLPLMVFGPLSYLRHGRDLIVDGDLSVPLPRVAGLLLEKLVTERSGAKGDRDLLVALGLLLVAKDDDLGELLDIYARLPRDIQHAVRSSVTTLSLLGPIAGMPDPTGNRARVEALLARLPEETR